jgi:hypothetical protein
VIRCSTGIAEFRCAAARTGGRFRGILSLR